MDKDSKDHDLLRLNALVDGELRPGERAELAGRLAVERNLAKAYAVLARLKATIGEGADEMPQIALPPTRARSGWRSMAAVAACAVAAIAIGLFGANKLVSEREAPIESPTAITLASLPAGTTVPRLDTAGLKLVSLAIEPGHVPIFTATYRGPHGCRLDLRAWPTGSAAPAIAGTSHYTWTAGALTYELVAHGMPAWRFDIIADASELQTRLNIDHQRINQRLRQAEIGAPPCAG